MLFSKGLGLDPGQKNQHFDTKHKIAVGLFEIIRLIDARQLSFISHSFFNVPSTTYLLRLSSLDLL